MANWFGLKWAGDDDSPPAIEKSNIIPSQWPSDDEQPLLLGQCTPTQSSVATHHDSFPSSTYSHITSTYSSISSTITPETVQQGRPKYTVKSGSMIDSRIKRKEREKKERKKSYTSVKKSTSKIEVAPNQMTMTQAYPSYSEVRKREENRCKLATIMKRPDPFDPRDEVPTKELARFARLSERRSFAEFIKNEKRKATETELQHSKPKKKKRLIEDDEIVRCSGCKQLDGNCHDLKYGRYCVDAVRAYYYSNKEIGIEHDEMVARKTFFDHYDYALHYEEYLNDKRSMKVVARKYPPPCMERFSYNDVMGWFAWKCSGE